ncbi:MAG: PQQ-dependent sugar dehydrogenase [Ardenticatenales bacterium]|nr:PQQ-dependent sugar dehydrogenase [Ardenticatenales bacterium]
MLLLACLLVGCTGTASDSPQSRADRPPLSEPTEALRLPDGYHAELMVEGLQGPTQMILGPDGRLWVAQLAGAENAGQGQVVALDMNTGSQELLLAGLDKPTGIARLDEALWLQAGNSLLRAPLVGDRVGTPDVMLADLPFNGRSLGTLTVTPEGNLLFETSGRRDGNAASEGSGILWELDPADPTHPRPLATGLKGAYAHAFDAAGRLWSTEIGDDPVNGMAPPDELNLIEVGSDYGWPACFGMQEPATNYGGSAAQCATTRAPVALFAERATPVAVVVSPWEAERLLVALWGPGDRGVVRVAVRGEGGEVSGEVTPFIEGMGNPQSLLVLPDGSLLAADFDGGRIYRITAEK